MGWYDGHDMGGGAWWFMGGFWLLVLALLALVVIKLLPSRTSDASSAARETPEDILDRRFARGEIDAAAYQEQRSVLEQSRGRRR